MQGYAYGNARNAQDPSESCQKDTFWSTKNFIKDSRSSSGRSARVMTREDVKAGPRVAMVTRVACATPAAKRRVPDQPRSVRSDSRSWRGLVDPSCQLRLVRRRFGLDAMYMRIFGPLVQPRTKQQSHPSHSAAWHGSSFSLLSLRRPRRSAPTRWCLSRRRSRVSRLSVSRGMDRHSLVRGCFGTWRCPSCTIARRKCVVYYAVAGCACCPYFLPSLLCTHHLRPPRQTSSSLASPCRLSSGSSTAETGP